MTKADAELDTVTPTPPEKTGEELAAEKTALVQRQIKALDEVSKPKLNFPHDFLEPVKAFGYNGSTIDGQTAPVNPLSPASDAERY